jgi:hypothetical protein
MWSHKEQRIFVKFCISIGKTAAETHNILYEAYSDFALSHMTTCDWLKYFILKMEELQWMRVSSLADHQLQELNL